MFCAAKKKMNPVKIHTDMNALQRSAALIDTASRTGKDIEFTKVLET